MKVTTRKQFVEARKGLGRITTELVILSMALFMSAYCSEPAWLSSQAGWIVAAGVIAAVIFHGIIASLALRPGECEFFVKNKRIESVVWYSDAEVKTIRVPTEWWENQSTTIASWVCPGIYAWVYLTYRIPDRNALAKVAISMAMRSIKFPEAVFCDFGLEKKKALLEQLGRSALKGELSELQAAEKFAAALEVEGAKVMFGLQQVLTNGQPSLEGVVPEKVKELKRCELLAQLAACRR